MSILESPRCIVVSVDDSAHSLAALKWCLRNVWRENDKLHLVTVLHPLTLSAYPVTPVITSASVTAIVHQTELQRKHEEVEAARVLKSALAEAMEHSDIPPEAIHTQVLPAAGGASGVAQSVVEYSKALEANVVVVGSRGMGSFKRSMMSLVGLGSVSDYCVHNLHCPVAVVKSAHSAQHAAEAGSPPQSPPRDAPRKVLLAPDSSAQSQAAMEWALHNLLQKDDLVHVISVALPEPFPVLDEGSATIAAMEAEEWRRTNTEALADAQLVCERAAKSILSSGRVRAENIWQHALTPAGGASDVGATICSYSNQHGMDVVVLGSRGLGAFKRSMMSLVGLGSVGDYCVHHLQNTVVVVKGKLGRVEEAELHHGSGNGHASGNGVH